MVSNQYREFRRSFYLLINVKMYLFDIRGINDRSILNILTTHIFQMLILTLCRKLGYNEQFDKKYKVI